MKKLVILAVAVTLALPAAVMAANPAPGKYNCQITSVLPELNNQTCTAEVKQVGTKAEAKVTYKNGDAKSWAWDDKTLEQKEFDKAGKETQKYGATFANGRYNINGDKATNNCDAKVDCRNYWTIDTTPNAFTYQVYGVNKDKQSDSKAPAALRHTFKFTKAN